MHTYLLKSMRMGDVDVHDNWISALEEVSGTHTRSVGEVMGVPAESLRLSVFVCRRAAFPGRWSFHVAPCFSG
jgi:hypothetical protein